jgi:hypothetical protein
VENLFLVGLKFCSKLFWQKTVLCFVPEIYFLVGFFHDIVVDLKQNVILFHELLVVLQQIYRCFFSRICHG